MDTIFPPPPRFRSWGVWKHIETQRGRGPVPGGASGDVYNSMYSVVAPGKGHMIPTRGTSYIQIVGFDDDGPVARALLAYSESSDPASPHVDDIGRASCRGRVCQYV